MHIISIHADRKLHSNMLSPILQVAPTRVEMDKWPSPVFGCAKEKKFAATVVYLDDEGQIYLQTEEQVGQDHSHVC